MQLIQAADFDNKSEQNQKYKNIRLENETETGKEQQITSESDLHIFEKPKESKYADYGINKKEFRENRKDTKSPLGGWEKGDTISTTLTSIEFTRCPKMKIPAQKFPCFLSKPKREVCHFNFMLHIL